MEKKFKKFNSRKLFLLFLKKKKKNFTFIFLSRFSSRDKVFHKMNFLNKNDAL